MKAIIKRVIDQNQHEKRQQALAAIRAELTLKCTVKEGDSFEVKEVKIQALSDFEHVAAGGIVSMTACPLRAKATQKEVDSYVARGFNLHDKRQPNDLVHLAMVFFNPRTNRIDVATAYRFATQPFNFVGVPSEEDTLDFKTTKKLTQAGVIQRDFSYVFDPEKRIDHETQTVQMHDKRLDTRKLADTLARFRKQTHQQILAELNNRHATFDGKEQPMAMHGSQTFAPLNITSFKVRTKRNTFSYKTQISIDAY